VKLVRTSTDRSVFPLFPFAGERFLRDSPPPQFSSQTFYFVLGALSIALLSGFWLLSPVAFV
jgi:hypothetical protein